MKVKLGLPLVLLLALLLLLPLTGCGSDTGTQESASADERAVIEKFMTGWDDPETLADVLTKDAILEDYTTKVTSEGFRKIVDYVSRYPTLSYEAPTQSIKVGDYIVQPALLMDDEDLMGYGVLVFEIARDGLIKHVWYSGAEVQ